MHVNVILFTSNGRSETSEILRFFGGVATEVLAIVESSAANDMACLSYGNNNLR
jgi:hypothetical protein